jgi:hypothetical protein
VDRFEIEQVQEYNEQMSSSSEDNCIYSSGSSEAEEDEEALRATEIREQKVRQNELSKLVRVKNKICTDKLGKQTFEEIISALRKQINVS